MKSRRPTRTSIRENKKRRADGVQVVGIGASAGGLDAFRRFFKAMPVDSGLAFVLIQHLSPDHESQIAQILSKSTTMKVREAVNGVPVEPNCVYVIPPNRTLSIKAGRLHLALPSEKRGLRTPIDHFLASLANDLGEKAVCIVLSSTGTDGILGVRAVKAAGGMCMVQDPSTAQYGDLPRSAITTGLVDYVLPVERMPRILMNYLSHAYMRGVQESGPSRPADPEPVLARIQDLLKSRTTHDFRFFKRGTLLRRIERRMGLSQVQKIGDYLNLLRRKPGEVIQLSKDLMIGVTQFFRDPEAFNELKARVIPSLVKQSGGDVPIRVWVPGCSTGEEAYSLLMLLQEELALSGRTNKIQVFATDIDEDALQFARAGHYPESIAADVNPQRLKRFFTSMEHGFLVNKTLRECVVFASQNLITSPPFSKIDIISCRNLAIYLEPGIQKRLVELFHFALNPGGCLFLGSSEGIANRDDLFRPISKKWRIYRRMGGGRRELGPFPIISGNLTASPPADVPVRSKPALNLNELDHQLMAEHLTAASALIDRKGRILYLAGRPDLYLELAHGEPSLELHTVAREGLRARLRAGVQDAFREEKKVVLERENVRHDGAYFPVRVTITPVKSPPAAEGYLHIIFEKLAEAPPTAASEPARGEKNEEVRNLENELKSTRDDLQNTIEALETANEELKVANEESLSSNEELQSTNEELETSKEELQSLNEELTTLNNQLQEKVQELTETTNDLANLLSSTEIATVFLDTKFRVKRFTSPVAKLLNLIPTDVGRPIRHIVQNLVDVDILGDAQAVMRKLVPVQRQVMSRKGSWYVMRVLPYRTTENVIEGVVVTFSDVSELAAKEAQLTERARRQKIIVELGHKALGGMPVPRLMNLAVRRVQEALQVDLSDILLPDAPHDRFTMAAGAGWRKAKVGSPVRAQGPAGPAVAFRTRSTVIMDAVPSPHGPKPSSLQKADKVVSGMYTILGAPAAYFGLIGAHSRRKRAFAPEDGLFLQDMANILASAMKQARAEAKLREMGRILEERVRERTHWLTASQEVSKAANRTGSIRDVMQRSLEALCTGTGWRFGHIFLASKDDPKVPVFQFSYYPASAAKFRAFEGQTRKARWGHDGTLPVLALQKGRPVWMAPAASSSNGGAPHPGGSLPRLVDRLKAPRAKLSRKLGIKSAAAIPLKVGDATVGMFEVFSDRAISPNRLMLDMMELIATEIARTVERMQTQERFASALWREQKKIGQELHDSVGQELTGLGAMSESLLNEMNRKGRVAAPRLKRLTKGLRATLEQLRNVTSGFFPMDVPPGEFMANLAKLARQTQTRHGIRCTIRGQVAGAMPGVEVTTHLFRIVQEAVANAVRHSKARRIEIRVERNPHELVLSVHDNGRGVDRHRLSSDGVGFRIMRFRSEAIGGRLMVKSSSHKGTVVTCATPLDGAMSQA